MTFADRVLDLLVVAGVLVVMWIWYVLARMATRKVVEKWMHR